MSAVQAQVPAALTADQQLNAANVDYAAGHWAPALAGYTAFIRDFGQRPEVAAVLPRLRVPVAQCYLQLKKYGEAIAAIEEALRSTPPPTAVQVQELTFQKGVCQAQEQEHAAARATLEGYLKQFPAARNVAEARLLIGTCFLLEQKRTEAADYFAGIKAGLSPIYRGRASVLELYALVEGGEFARGLAVVQAESPRVDEMLQAATFQILTLELGAQFLERGEYRNAIACLSRIGSAARLVDLQQKRLATLEGNLAALEANPKSDPAQRALLAQLIGKVRAELESFRKIPNFDSALRLRLATAFQAMQRYREAALILEGMLRDLPPDTIVEQASVSLVQCWGQIERWPRVSEAAQAFVKKFPKSASIPLVRYLQGTAEQKNGQLDESIATFLALAKDFPKSDFAPRALFMEGFTRLLADAPREAIPVFEKFQREFPEHDLADAAAYWRGMAFSLDKQFERCREVMDENLAKFPRGQNRGLALFRKAYATHSLRDYKGSIAELRAYLREFPGHESNSEALVLLGDALMAEGQMEEGITAFKRIAPEDVRFFEEGWFKVGKALKLLEREDDLRTHMEQFAREHPQSGRIGEAIYWVGWCHRQAGRPEEARKLYWETIARHGDDPAIRSVDDLFGAAGKLYKGDAERAQFVAKLRDLREDADRHGRKTLAMRALWAQARVWQKREPEKSRELFLEAAARANVQTDNPLLLADFADAFAAAGKTTEAEKMWRDLLKWNPRAPQKDRALAAIGLGELARGNERAALELFERFEQETAGSPMLGKVLLARAKLLEQRGEFAPAQKALEALLADKPTPGAIKSEALFRLAELQMRQNKPQLAVPYYQRIYVMYGRFPDWVAKAYLRSGEAFEKLQDNDAARKTYEELIANEQLANLPEHQQAADRLAKLQKKEAL